MRIDGLGQQLCRRQSVQSHRTTYKLLETLQISPCYSEIIRLRLIHYRRSKIDGQRNPLDIHTIESQRYCRQIKSGLSKDPRECL